MERLRALYDLINGGKCNVELATNAFSKRRERHTTIIAAEITGRSCHAIELMPQYVDVAIERWQAFTGETARLEADGRNFTEITAERLPAKAS